MILTNLAKKGTNKEMYFNKTRTSNKMRIEEMILLAKLDLIKGAQFTSVFSRKPLSLTLLSRERSSAPETKIKTTVRRSRKQC